jgi:peptidoglycan pentaglycine glycine transferase (the first glycine)
MSYRLEERPSAATLASIDALVASAPNGHYTQHPGWATLPAEDPRARPLLFIGEEAGQVRVAATVVLRRTPMTGHSLVDVFRGPVAASPGALLSALPALEALLRPMKPLALRVDPYWSGDGSDQVRRGLAELGYLPLADPPWHTVSAEVAIDRAPDELLHSFAGETRRQVQKATRLEIEVREDLDDAALAEFIALYQSMSERKGATPHSAGFLKGIRDLWRSWPRRGFFLASWLHGELLGAIAVFTAAERAIYAYGASRAGGPGIPKNHVLQFAAMRRAAERGCRRYDLGGYSAGTGDPAARTPTQKVNFFKRGFNGRVVEFVGGHQRLVRPASYQLVRALDRLWRRFR